MAMYITGSSLICRFPLGRNARHESCRGLHLPTFDKEQDIAAAKTSAPDEDTSTTALGVSTSELPKEGASLPFILGEGLPPVAAKLVVKIQRGDFVDMAELMRDNMEAERRAEQDGAIGSPFNKQSRRREVPDLKLDPVLRHIILYQCGGRQVTGKGEAVVGLPNHDC